MSLTVFISHSLNPTELGILCAVADHVRARGLKPLIPSRDWEISKVPAGIRAGVAKADCVLGLATKHGRHNIHVNAELSLARGKPILLLADREVQFSDKTISRSRVVLDRKSFRRTMAQTLRRMEALDLASQGREAMAWLLVGGLLFLILGDTK